jgi:hypothetical protein
MNAPTTITLPAGMAPVAPLLRMLASFDRPKVEAFLEVGVALLDLIDGDADDEAEDRGGETVPVRDNLDEPPLEDEGDPDLEETDAEDSFVLSGQALAYASGPGCPISDPGGGLNEDDEEDDPAGVCDEDGVNTNLENARTVSSYQVLNGDEGDYSGSECGL